MLNPGHQRRKNRRARGAYALQDFSVITDTRPPKGGGGSLEPRSPSF